MKKILEFAGRAAFWITWPALYIYLRNTRRTRVLIICEGELLVVKHWLGRDFWQLPGGGLHKEENVLTGAARELFEETQFVISPEKLQYLGPKKTDRGGIPMTLEYVVAYVPHKPAVHAQKLEIRVTRWLALDDPAILASRSTYDAVQLLNAVKAASATI